MADSLRPFRITHDIIVIDPDIINAIDERGALPHEGVCELRVRREESSVVCVGRECARCSIQGARGDFCLEEWAIHPSGFPIG
jgi:hypothetical protein